MSIAIGTYISFEPRIGNPTNLNFQNFHAGEVRVYDGLEYIYAAFGFSGAAVDAQAANIQASLVFGVNQLGLQLFQTAANGYFVVRVKTVWLNPDSLDETNLRLEEVYAVNGFEHDNTRVSLRLGSPLDSISQNVPRRSLNQRIVGALPSTGNVSFI
jgi:hypothetical protein